MKMIGVWIFGGLGVGLIGYVPEDYVGAFRGQGDISSAGVSWYLGIF